MQEALIGNWAQESHLSGEHLGSLHELNHRFLDLAGCNQTGWAHTARPGLSSAIAGRVAPLSKPQRAAAAHCPYALFDLRFQDAAHWSRRLDSAREWRVADEPGADREIIDFVQLALFYAWHIAARAGLAARLLLGMNSDTAEAFRRITVDSLPALVATEAANLTARWSDCSAYWNALTGAASSTDPAALRRVQLYGLQLAAASKLPRA